MEHGAIGNEPPSAHQSQFGDGAENLSIISVGDQKNVWKVDPQKRTHSAQNVFLPARTGRRCVKSRFIIDELKESGLVISSCSMPVPNEITHYGT
jgi:hypothetical protein